jgi:CBS domain containing-hemolysin-like protein
MVARIPVDATAGEAGRICVESGHTRVVVTELDGGVRGVVHANRVLELVLSAGDGAPIEPIVVDPLVVPETRALPDLLRGLRAAHISLAIVVDEYGRMAGVVSIEDVLEEIVGEIADETDPSELPVRTVGEGEWLAQGEVSLADLADHGIVLNPDSDAITSLGGLVLHLAGRLPEVGDRFERDGFELTVAAVEGTRVAEVRVRRLTG